MINYKVLNELLEELKRTNTSVDSKLFFEKKLGTHKETFKTARLSIEKLVRDGYVDKLGKTYVIITPDGYEFEGYRKGSSKKDEKRIFISHAYKDGKIAERIIDKLLVDTLGISKEEIFFTSTRSTGIKSGKTWKEQIKKNLKECEIFVGLFTPNYHLSEMCHAELGAAWFSDKVIFSLYLAPIQASSFSKVISEKQADNLRRREEVISFLDQMTEEYNKISSKKLQPNDYETGLNLFYRSLRAYLRKEAIKLGIDYEEKAKLDKL
ncbi:MAG: hypothetical protein CL840_06835 [Crocinitomicaceae bacterium]|nr:hypothetical protein [Crocinitomicaceae bacterium]|tara:strand:- start:18041 stop:18838 length:798 start_codon:yes stop_codon:yes gene_type:complete